MSAPQRRILGFERLERKASPCSLLLHVAAAEHGLTEEVQREVGLERDWASGNWKHQIATADLLRFIEGNTSDIKHDRPGQIPTSNESETADEMMKLDDIDLRSMIVFAAMEFDAAGSTLD